MNTKDEFYRGYLETQKQAAYEALSDPNQSTDSILETARRYFALEKKLFRMDNPIVRVPKTV